MRIAISSVITRAVTPQTYGGTEAFTYELVEALVKRGHDVTLYASSDSQTSARLISVVDSLSAREKVRGELLSQAYYLRLAQKLAEDSSQYDIIHNNFFHYYFFAAFSPYLRTPTVHTIHNSFFSSKKWQDALIGFTLRSNETMVFVSESARELAGNPSNSSVISNGIDTALFPFSDTNDDYFLWLGRMIPRKGPGEAAEAAQKAHVQLILNTAAEAKRDEEYYALEVKPYLDEGVRMLHKETQAEKVKLYQRAKALLFPANWEEPFGLVMIEAMSCGVPVIGYARGGVLDIVVDGKTGFLINPSKHDMRGDFMIKQTGKEGLATAMKRIGEMNHSEYQLMRKACRKRVEDQFTLSRVVDQYEALYHTLMKGKRG